jgi:outer membrane receptor protein involved in Fe transport
MPRFISSSLTSFRPALASLAWAGLVSIASSRLAAQATDTAAADQANPETLGQVVVTGTRIGLDQLDTPITVTSVSHDEIEDSGANSLADVMEKIPGLQIGAQGGTYLRFATRGFRMTNDVLVLIDGVPFRQVNGNADLINLPLGLVENVEYAKGPGSSIYGRDAVGGVVQIFTDAPIKDTVSGEVIASAASFGTYGMTVRVTAPTPGGGINADFGATTSDGFEARTANNQQFLKLSDVQQLTPNLKVYVSYLDEHYFTYRSGAVPLVNGDPAYGFNVYDNLAVPDTVFKTNFQSFTVTPTLTLGEWTVTNVANYSRYQRDYDGGIQTSSTPGFTQGYSQDFSVQDILYEDLSAMWQHTFGPLHNTLLFGGTFENGFYTDVAPTFSDLPTFNPPNYTTPVTNAAYYPYGLKGANVNTYISQPIGSAYVEERGAIGPVSLLLGARYDSAYQSYSNSTLTQAGSQTVSAVSPRASGTYDFYKGASDETSFFVSFSKSFKPLAPSASTSGGVTIFELLQPEVADSYEFGFKGYDFDRKIFWQVSAYQIEKANAQRFYRVNALTYLIAQDEQRVRGFEGEVEYHASKWLEFYADYAYTDAINVNYVTTTANLSDNQIAMNPRNTAGAGVNLRQGAFSIDVTSNFTGTRPLRDDINNSMILPSYLIENVVLAYDFKRTTFQVGVDNLANVYYISDNLNGFNDGQPGMPRSIFGKVIYRF